MCVCVCYILVSRHSIPCGKAGYCLNLFEDLSIKRGKEFGEVVSKKCCFAVIVVSLNDVTVLLTHVIHIDQLTT